MKTSELITALKAEQEKFGNLDIHFGNGNEYIITNVQHVAAGESSNLGPVFGKFQSQPERLVITGESI